MDSMEGRVRAVEQAQHSSERELILRYEHLAAGQERLREALEKMDASLVLLNAAVAKRAGGLAVLDWIGKAAATLAAGGSGALLAHYWGPPR